MNQPTLASILLALAGTLGTTGCSQTDESPAAEVSVATPIETRTVVFEIQGMHCDGCANAISTKAGRVEGVVACEASFEDGTAVVEVDPDAVDDVQAAIASLGYTVVPSGG